jgi:hypothetical protein
MGCFDFIGNSPPIGAGGGGGGSGVTLSEIWTFDSATGDADPGSKKFRLNNATQSSATFIYISKTSDNGVNWGNVLLELKTGDNVYTQDKDDQTRFHLFDVSGTPVDATTYVKIPVTVDNSGSDLLSGKKCGFIFQFAGTISAATLPQGYMSGLEANYETASTVTIEPGKCKNDTEDSDDITVASQLTADITTGGANGLDTGSEASNTWYSIWTIWNPTSSTAAALLSLSATSPTMPSGYTKKRLVGWVKNGSTGNFIEFRCFGKGRTKKFMFLEWWPVLTNGSATSWTAVDCSAYVPPGVFSCFIDSNADGGFADDAEWGQYDGSTSFPHYMGFEGVGQVNMAYATLDSSRRLGYMVGSLSVDMDIHVFGWEGNF